MSRADILRGPAVLLVLGVLCFGTGLPQAAIADDTNFRQQGTTQLVLDPEGFRTRVADLEFSPDGGLLVAGGEKEVRIYDVRAGQLVKTLRGDRSETPYGSVYATAFNPRGGELLVGIDDFSDAGSIRVYDVNNLDKITQLVGGMNVPIRRLAFSRDGRYLAASGENGNIYIWDWPARRIVHTIPPAQADQPILDALAFPTDKPVLFAMGINGPKLYSIPDGRQLTPRDQMPPEVLGWIRNFAGRQLSIPFTEAGFVPNIWELMLDRDLFITGSEGRNAGKPVYAAGVFAAGGKQATTTYTGHKWRLSAIAAAKVGDLAASADLFGEVHVWNRRNGQPVHRFKSLGQRLYEVSFDQSATRIAYGTKNYTGAEYRRNHFGPAEFVFDLPRRSIGDVEFAANLTPQVEFTQAGNFEIKLEQRGLETFLISYENSREKARYRNESGRIPTCYTLLEKHGFDIPHPVVYGDDEGLLACWNADTDRLHRAFVGHGQMVTSIGPSKDGKYLVSCSTDGEICVFPLTGRQPTGDMDFRRQSDLVIEVKPGTSSERAGVKNGDRILTFDGKSVSELENLLFLGKYDYKPGQQVNVEMERDGRKFNYSMTLADGPDYVEPLLHVFISGDREWIVWTKQGYYDASPGADRLIGWHVNRGPAEAAEFHAVQQFRKQLYRPDIIDKVIELGNVEAAIAAANAAAPIPVDPVDLRNKDEFDRLHPPVVEILSPAGGTISDSDTITVEASISSPNDSLVREVTFLLDGNPAKVERPNAGANGQSITLTAELKLTPGPHVIGIIASNGQTTSPNQTVRVAYRGGQQQTTNRPVPREDLPNLYALAIGIAEYQNDGKGFSNLQYPAKDAAAFVEVVESHRGGRLYGSVETKLLTNEQATRANIIDAFDWLVHSAKQGDMVLVYISAHGFLDDRKNGYLASHDVDLDKLRATGVAWDTLTTMLHEDFAPCKRMLFLDTCHSGSAQAGRLIFDPTHDLVAPEVGVVVLTSCSPREESLESSAWGHGAFTKAILDILKDKQRDISPLPAGDSMFIQSELKLGVIDVVKELTRDRQHPTLSVPPTMREFPVLEVIARD
ncbi:MAG: caspase family protein [Planctomycetaceae bacterium]